MKKSITILGAGAFGTSIATLLGNNGFEVVLWSHESQVVSEIEKDRENKTYLSGIKLGSSIIPTTDLKLAVQSSEWIFEAIPVKFLRSVFDLAKEFISQDQKIVILSKGIEQNTHLLPSQVVDDVLGGKAVTQAVMAGPNFARELASNFYSAATVACADKIMGQELCAILNNSYFKTNFTTDIIGVQAGGAIKNVLTLAVGILQGITSSQNTQAMLLTNGLKEIASIVDSLGGDRETVYGFSGLGDLLLTATGTLSRNLQAGRLLGQGKSLDDLKDYFPALPEGINTLKSVYFLINKYNLDLPVCLFAYKAIYEDTDIKHLFRKIF